MSNYNKKSKTGSVVFWVAVSLALLLLAVGICAAMTEGFTNSNPYGWFDKDNADKTPSDEPAVEQDPYVGKTFDAIYVNLHRGSAYLGHSLMGLFYSGDPSVVYNESMGRSETTLWECEDGSRLIAQAGGNSSGDWLYIIFVSTTGDYADLFSINYLSDFRVYTELHDVALQPHKIKAVYHRWLWGQYLSIEDIFNEA